jgi:hypothetical protein
VSASRSTVLWGLIAERAAAAGRRVAVEDVCAVAVSGAQASGAWLAAASHRGPDFVMCVTDRVSEQLAELQLLLGEGPGPDVLAAAAPVLAADLGDEESGRRWPAFTPEARNAGAAAADGNGFGTRPGGQSPDLAVHRVEIDQATGMLTVQLGVTAGEAFARLRAYAYARDRRLADVAGDIVARRMRLDPDPAQGGAA